MTENHENGHDNQKLNPAEDENVKENSGNDPDIIELSDIAIGITPEDDVIVELTEEIIGEAFVGFAGATSEVVHDDERVLDLSETSSGIDASADQEYPGRVSDGPESDDISGVADMEADNLEEDISKELDNYFGTEDDTPVTEETTLIGTLESETPEPTVETETQSEARAIDEKPLQIDEISISTRQLDDAIERIIRKMFAEKINRILDDVIGRTVSEEISQLKDYLLGISGKK
ncbi:MAG: hypothetical protein HF978_20800 [Desulfobacteraceae bacterium]|nr:hypothetical protein [Desulfobacteraceae bacterium]MBC2757989.1 hypothetical protein [Desulfobacteraceae bacterium]